MDKEADIILCYKRLWTVKNEASGWVTKIQNTSDFPWLPQLLFHVSNSRALSLCTIMSCQLQSPVCSYTGCGLFVPNLFSLVKLLNRLLPDSPVKHCTISQLQWLSQMSLFSAKYYRLFLCVFVWFCNGIIIL